MTNSEDYTYDIIKIKDFLEKTKEDKKNKKENKEEQDLQFVPIKNRLKAYINLKYKSFKKTLKNLKEPIQKILTLTDIATDIRTCYIMYDINAYWYTIMLSAIVTPFIVFWASSYNFQFVVKLRDCADSDSKCANKALSIWITALSLPILGIILTIIEILGLYLLDLMKRCIPIFIADESNKGTCKYKIINFLQNKQQIIINHEIIKFWNWCLEEFNSGSREFFQICELFFESVPQVILQLWIYLFHSESFTNSLGKPLLTTFDISLSLGAAILNIIINGYEIKNKARVWGLSISSYIPYFMGSQLNIVKDSCIPVKNWLNTNRYSCDLSHIERFFASKMIKQSNREITKYVETFPSCKSNSLINPKKIVIPLKTNETINDIYEVDIKRTDLILFLINLRNAQDRGIIAIDINEFGHTDNKYLDQIFQINKIIISENRLDCDFLKESHICDYSDWFNNIPIINKFTRCKYKNRYKVPLIEKFTEEISVKNKLFSKLMIIGWARKYLNYIECNACCADEAEIYDELHEASKLIWSGINQIKNKPKLLDVNEGNNCCEKLLYCKQNSHELTNIKYYDNIYKKIETMSLEKPFFYNYIQYISIITMLFNPIYFYMYQSITTQFYIILSIYGDKRILLKIYKTIKYLLTEDKCCTDEYLFSKYSFQKWRTLVYMNSELLSKCERYLQHISGYDKDSDFDFSGVNGSYGANDYLTKIIYHSLVKTLDITTYKRYKLPEYEIDPKKRLREMVLKIPEYTNSKNMHIKGFKMIVQTCFDLEHRYYHITNFKLLEDNYDKIEDSFYPSEYLTMDTINKNKINLPAIVYTNQRTNSTKFIFVKKEQRGISPGKYEDPDSNYNEYYILTQCRKYFLNFEVNKYEFPSMPDDDGNETTINYIAEPYLISRKGFIGKSPDNSVVQIIDSGVKMYPPPLEKEKATIFDLKKISISEEENTDNNDETKVNVEDNEDDVKINIE